MNFNEEVWQLGYDPYNLPPIRTTNPGPFSDPDAAWRIWTQRYMFYNRIVAFATPQQIDIFRKMLPNWMAGARVVDHIASRDLWDVDLLVGSVTWLFNSKGSSGLLNPLRVRYLKVTNFRYKTDMDYDTLVKSPAHFVIDGFSAEPAFRATLADRQVIDPDSAFEDA